MAIASESSRVETRNDGETSTIALVGEHDLATAPPVFTAIDKALESQTRLVVDLTHATFIDSAILRALIYGHARARQFSVIAPPEGFPRRVLGIAGLESALNTTDTRPEASS